MERLKSSTNIFYWLQFLVVAICIIYSFTFTTFHVHQAGFGAKLFNYKLPFINGMFLYFVLAIGIVVSLVKQIVNKHYYQASIFDCLLIAGVLYHAISLFWVIDFGLGLAALTTSISFYVFYYLLSELFNWNGQITIKWLRILIGMLTMAFVAHFFVGNFDVLLKFKNADSSFQKIITQSKSWVGGKNQTACFLALLLPIVIFLNHKKRIAALLGSIIVVHILMMGSRNAYIALIVFGGIYLLFNKIKPKQLAIATILLFIMLVIFGTFVGFDVFANQLKNNTWGSRFIFWQQTLKMGLDNWLLGVGAGQWDAYRLQYDVWHTYRHPHNDFIRSFAELGILGWLFFYSTIIAILVSAFKNLKHQTRLASIAIAAIMVYLSLSFFDELKMKDNYNILLAIIFVLINYSFHSFKLTSTSSKLVRFGLFSFLFIAAFYLVIYPLKLQNEMHHYKKYKTHLKQKERDLAIDELKAINQNFVNSIDRNPVAVLIANTYFNAKKIDSASLYYKKLAKRNPYYINQLEGALQLSVIRNKKYPAWIQLAKIYFLDPCNAVLEDNDLEMPAYKKSTYFKNIIKQQAAKCPNP